MFQRYETVSQAAARTAMSPKTLRRRIACGLLPCYVTGNVIRLRPEDVDALLVRRVVAAS
ncbi:MAG: helix-turn-helix domain-containing protein [Micropruina sp.]|nr:MAG: helix-turn-helix domain-containing protein [Micropruina sp.]